ncbi:hypothetical protein [Bifidobacterium avesanii]|uniref:FtsX-like permease family protein n=1 Tax=Bifidobacterium avesanii TaxID=1798157 RepID=A0A7K3TI95_9BIFI|nr:hypothetical protein [Bifidobacterium avesanii]KAB8290614.1 hypothetical protein DSM100685_1407 [Bifidobacterium avesanii]NEG77983.1 hypothetical protein [Bifidobacterium avesanii]
MSGKHRDASWWWPLAEAKRDLVAGVGNPGLWACLFMVILLMCGGADALSVRQLADAAWAYRESGGDILTISSPGGIRGRDCAALGSIDGVQGAMAMRGADAVTPLALPDAPYLAYEVTDGARNLIDIDGDDGFVIASKIGEQLGIGAGDGLVTADGISHTVTGTYAWPNDGRLPQYATTILLATPATELDTMFDSCWVRAWPMTAQIRDALNAVVTKARDVGPIGGTSVPTPTRLNPLLAGNAPGAADYRGRITRFAVVPAMLLSAVAGAAAVLQRRVELAMLRQFGATRPQVAEKMLGVALGWSVPAAVASLGLLALVLAPAAGSVSDALRLFGDVAVRAVAGGLCGLYLGTLAAACLISPRSLPALVRMR